MKLNSIKYEMPVYFLCTGLVKDYIDEEINQYVWMNVRMKINNIYWGVIYDEIKDS